jgi:hypothetical protein
MIATLDREKAMELLEQAVQLKGPDYRDPAALSDAPDDIAPAYFVDGAPSCILGYVLSNFEINKDISNEEFPDLIDQMWVDGEVAFEAPDQDYYPGGTLERNKDLVLTSGAVSVLRAAQAKQDSGYSWGIALEKARQVSDNFEKSGYGV